MTTGSHRNARDRSAREAKLAAVQQQLGDAVGALVTGEDWRRAMVFAAKFRSRSFNNTLLIYTHHAAAHAAGRVPDPSPTYVAGFRQWQALGRTVMKGQSGYAILAPVTARMASTNPADPSSWRRLGPREKPRPAEVVRTRMVGVQPAYVWDVSQTMGDPLPQPPHPELLRGQAPEGLWDGLADAITARGFDLRLVSDAASIGGANGLTDFVARSVTVRVDMDDAAQVKTLAHELGHVILHAPDELSLDAALHRGIAEVEAESVALMIGAAHGMDTTSYTVPYVASWAASVPGQTPTQVVTSTAERVRRTALGILDQLETTTIGDGTPAPHPEVAPTLRPSAPPVRHIPAPAVVGR